jgi:hypothetical protein
MFIVEYNGKQFPSRASDAATAAQRFANRNISGSKYLWVNGWMINHDGTGRWQAYVPAKHGGGSTSIGETIYVSNG